MNALLIVLGLATLGLAGVAVWLAMGRGRLAAEAARAVELASLLDREREMRGAAERCVAELKAERAALEGRHRVEVSKQAELFEERFEAQERAHEAALRQKQLVLDEREQGLRSRQEMFEKEVAATRERMKAEFGDLAGRALATTTEEFIKRADQKFAQHQQSANASLEARKAEFSALVQPIGDTLKKAEEKLTGLSAASTRLEYETGKLARALAKPDVRGRYGEAQLRRVAELAGMKDYCDFTEQVTQRDDDGKMLRPDMVVRLPNERVIAVDAKANLAAYLEAAQAETDAEREACLDRFGKNVEDQVSALSSKAYWKQFDASPEFVVMFVPADQFLDAALARREGLLERAAEKGVILATPSSLIALLRAVAVGWREKKIEQEARALFDLGRELHERAAVAFEHVKDLGSALERAMNKFNAFVGSYQSRLEPTLQKFEEAGVKSARELPEVVEVTVRPRLVGAGEG